MAVTLVSGVVRTLAQKSMCNASIHLAPESCGIEKTMPAAERAQRILKVAARRQGEPVLGCGSALQTLTPTLLNHNMPWQIHPDPCEWFCCVLPGDADR